MLDHLETGAGGFDHLPGRPSVFTITACGRLDRIIICVSFEVPPLYHPWVAARVPLAVALVVVYVCVCVCVK